MKTLVTQLASKLASSTTLVATTARSYSLTTSLALEITKLRNIAHEQQNLLYELQTRITEQEKVIRTLQENNNSATLDDSAMSDEGRSMLRPCPV